MTDQQVSTSSAPSAELERLRSGFIGDKYMPKEAHREHTNLLQVLQKQSQIDKRQKERKENSISVKILLQDLLKSLFLSSAFAFENYSVKTETHGLFRRTTIVIIGSEELDPSFLSPKST